MPPSGRSLSGCPSKRIVVLPGTCARRFASTWRRRVSSPAKERPVDGHADARGTQRANATGPLTRHEARVGIAKARLGARLSLPQKPARRNRPARHCFHRSQARDLSSRLLLASARLRVRSAGAEVEACVLELE